MALGVPCSNFTRCALYRSCFQASVCGRPLRQEDYVPAVDPKSVVCERPRAWTPPEETCKTFPAGSASLYG